MLFALFFAKGLVIGLPQLNFFVEGVVNASECAPAGWWCWAVGLGYG